MSTEAEIKALREVTRQGDQARRDGYGLRDNPHPPKSPEWAEWQFGWLRTNASIVLEMKSLAEVRSLEAAVQNTLATIEPAIRDLIRREQGKK